MDSDATRRRAQLLAQLDEVEVTVERIVEGGDGLARAKGLPIFISRAAPGDRLRVRIVQRRRDYGRAEIVEILEPGPARQKPPCEVYELCGGCDLQHVSEAQLEIKVSAAQETLRRLGGITVSSPRVLSGSSWGYRTRAQLHLEVAGVGEEREVQLGFFKRRSREVVGISACPVLDGELNELLGALPERLREVENLPNRLDMTVGDDGVAVAPRIAGLPSQSVTRRVGDTVLEYDARCFFQGNAGLLERFVDCVVGGSRAGQRAWDLYAGVGLFTIALSRSYERVVAVETDRIAARYATRNARRNRSTNVSVEVRSVDGYLAQQDEAPDLVVIDPPRGGLSSSALERLLELRPPRITYVSCQVPTLARDLRSLCRDYELEELTFVDLFAQTAHLEAVAQLARRRA